MTVERHYAMTDTIPVSVSTADGVMAYRDIAAEHGGGKRHAKPWPYFSEAMAVDPSQRAELIRFCKDKGVPTHVDEHGRPEIRDRGHRRRFMAARHICDRDAGYGDRNSC
jgi:hypothetical protein